MTKVIPHNWISSSRGPYYNQRTPDNPRLSVTNIFYIWDEPCHEANPIQTLAFSALHNWTFSTFHNWDRTCHEANPIQTFHNTHTARPPYPRTTAFIHYHTLIHFPPPPFAKNEEIPNISTCNTFTSLSQTHTRLIQNILSYIAHPKLRKTLNLL